jgi:AraC family transcriptional regulator
MTTSRSLLSLDANTDRLSQVTAYGETADGLTLELRSDPAGALDVPGLPNVLVAVHVGHSAKISCRSGGVNYNGSAAHGDIDIVPAGTPARWEMHDQHDKTLLLGVPCSLLNTVAGQHGFDSRRVELRNRFQIRDTQLEYIAWAFKTEMQSGYPSGRLYMEGVSEFSHQSHLAQHLRRVSGLSPRVMQRLFADLSSR